MKSQKKKYKKKKTKIPTLPFIMVRQPREVATITAFRAGVLQENNILVISKG